MKVPSANGFSVNPIEVERKPINSELWHACAGPLASLPPAGSLVVYFPQGHSEQVAASMQRDTDSIPNYPSLPSKLICVLHNVTLHADAETDEVYAQMTLQPVNKYDNGALLTSELGLKQNKQPSDFFCKALTASDTSTHGGFSVPRRAAEKIFPPLDFTLQPPAQEIAARDLHDVSWTFRHIYRGQPKRHLLTTGWSVFISAKRLLAGDSVLFIRDEKSQLLLGIRRANRVQPALSSSVLSSDSMHIGILAAAAHAAANNSPFTIFYNPRTSPSEFVVPLAKYNKSMYTQLSLGMRFRMMFETEESGVRRYMGTITGISDLDPVRWKNSQWRNLQVGWDESTASDRQTRVSVWEIEPVATPFYLCPPPFFRPKFPKPLGMPDDESEVENAFKRAMPWLSDDFGMRDAQSSVFPGHSLAQWMAMQQNPQLFASAIQSYFPSVTPPTMQDDLSVNDPSRILNFQSQLSSSPNLQNSQKLNPQHQPLDQNPVAGFQQLQSQQQNSIHLQQQQQLKQQQRNQQNHQVQNQLSHLVDKESVNQQQQKQQQRFETRTSSQAQLLNQILQSHSLNIQHQGLQTSSSQLQQPALPQMQQFQQQEQQQLQVQLTQPQIQPQSQFSPLLQTQHNQQFQQKQNLQHQLQNHIMGTLHPQLLVRSQSTPTDNNTPSCSASPSSNNIFSPSRLPNIIQQRVSSLAEEFVHPADNLLQEFQTKREVRTNNGFQCVKDPDQLQDERSIADQLDASSATSFCLDGNTHEGFSLPTVSLDGEFEAETQNNYLLGTNSDNLLPISLPSRGFGSVKDMENLVSPYGNQRDVETELSTAAISSQSFGVPDLSFNPGCSSDVVVNETGGVLNRGSWANQPQRMRTYTKVQKRGSVGRSIDVTRYRGYGELRRDLAFMFGIEGQLDESHRTDWKLVYVDHEKDILLVGDDPWEEFVNCVQSIKILSAVEVQQMSLDGDLNIPMQQNQAFDGSDIGNAWRGPV